MRLEEVLNKLDLEKMPTAMLRHLLYQTIETLKVARKRIEEQELQIDNLDSLTTIDPTTRLVNSRGFDQIMHMMLARAERDATGGALVIFRLDDLNIINDIYGDSARVALLIRVAQFLSESVRQSDVIARLGTNKFAILMPGVNNREADARSNALSDNLNRLIIPWNGRVINIRATVGGTCYGPTDNLDILCHWTEDNLNTHKSCHRPIRIPDVKHDS